MPGIEHYLVLSATVFAIGVAGVLTRKNALIIFMSVELMLNAVNISFVGFSRFLESVDGQVIVFFVLTVAAAEAAVGLAILIAIFRARQTVEVDNLNLMSG